MIKKETVPDDIRDSLVSDKVYAYFYFTVNEHVWLLQGLAAQSPPLRNSFLKVFFIVF